MEEREETLVATEEVREGIMIQALGVLTMTREPLAALGMLLVEITTRRVL